LYYCEDFVGANYDNRIWGSAVSGGSTVAKIIAVGGQVELAASAGNSAELNQGGRFNYSVDRYLQLSARVRLEGASTSVQLFLGAIDSAGTGFVRWVADTATSANWIISSRNGGTENYVPSSIALDTAWHDFMIVCAPGSVVFLLDGAFVGELTTNLPSNELQLFMKVVSLTSARSARIDWIEAFGARL
jgi:hypothetical protein